MSQNERMRGRLAHIGEVLGPALEKVGPKTLWTESKIRKAWPSIVGEELAQHVRIRRLRGTTLHVDATSDTWATEFRYLAQVVMEKLNSRVEPSTVTDIVVRRVRPEPGRHR